MTMTNPPPVAPVVTSEMVEFAYSAWRSSLHNILPEDQCVQDHYNAIRAAITVAIEASGELERLRAAVKLAEDTFKWYGDLHAAKPDMEKAHRNYELAQHMATALQGGVP